MFIKFALGLFVFNSNEVSALQLKSTVREGAPDPDLEKGLLPKAKTTNKKMESGTESSVSDDSSAGDGAGRGLKEYVKKRQVAIKFVAILFFVVGCVSLASAIWHEESPDAAVSSIVFAVILFGTIGSICAGGCHTCCSACFCPKKGNECLMC